MLSIEFNPKNAPEHTLIALILDLCSDNTEYNIENPSPSDLPVKKIFFTFLNFCNTVSIKVTSFCCSFCCAYMLHIYYMQHIRILCTNIFGDTLPSRVSRKVSEV